jgi:hypothetical protein
MKTKIKQYKQELKDLAKEIRRQKSTRKEVSNGYVWGLQSNQLAFRYKHIAYCMLRGRKYEEIEQPTKQVLNKYDWKQIDKLMEGEPHEDACPRKERSAVVA